MNTWIQKWQKLRQTEREYIESIAIFDNWLLELVTIDNQANYDLKRVVDMAVDHVAKRQQLNPMYEHPQQYDQSMNCHLSATQNQYPPDENRHPNHASGAKAVLPFPQENRTINNSYCRNVDPHNDINRRCDLVCIDLEC